MFTLAQLQNLKGFLDRVNLNGKEVPAWVELFNVISNNIAALTQPLPAVVRAVKEALPEQTPEDPSPAATVG